MKVEAAHRAIDAVWRKEAGRIVAHVMRVVGDLSLAEDLAHDAFLAALEQWPKAGVPDNPGAWLTAIAKRRAIDALRRRSTAQRKQWEVERHVDLDRSAEPDIHDTLDDPVKDDLLRLIFICCHPILKTEARVALTLRLLGGLTTEEIARAFLVPVPTVAQRMVRAKRAIAEARVPFELPPVAELSERLASVLEVVYLIFTEGYAATEGDDWVRPALCREAMRLGHVLKDLAPDEGEVHGLVALMEIQASRLGARVSATGEPILLLDQDRSRWDRQLIASGLASLEQAYASPSVRRTYTLQAAIAACHARAASPDATAWTTIASLYDQLAEIQPSPVVALNRAVAIAMAFGPDAGLEAIEHLANEPMLGAHHMLPSIRGDLLARVGRTAEARLEFQRAASLARNARERKFLQNRAAELDGSQA